ncbi:hypothetical protein OSB04_016299 [Centaurea solstitialis]|uniref:non-specific serine/threonine protein kinase n=1 Tax=Centaurea solstitialis TaxID=347529 RepID=A0AA38T0N7_9ASTR|nr:hypothetical protein OSB04_016299 [Centaurea solstitialis]
MCKTGDALNAFKTQLNDPNNVLQSWDATLVNPCTWFGVTCSESGVIGVELGNADLSGQLVPQLGQLTNLRNLSLFSNNLTGRIPSELGNLRSLVRLDLYKNRLEGDIPDTLGNLKKLGILFANNPNLMPHVYIPPTPAVPPPPNSQSASGTGLLTGLLITCCIALAWQRKKLPQDQFFDVPAEEDPKVHLGQLKRFSLRELQVATDHFSSRNILGRGGYAKVYKGRLADFSKGRLANGGLVAVKRLKDVRIQGGELQFQTEVKMISNAVHRNVLWLRGFCMTPTERLLVYPYMANGSVASCLRAYRPDTQAALDWPTRKRIALGSARGLAYLHDQCNPKIIHRDVKAANILLDEDFEAVVGDFGLATVMDFKDTHVTTAVRGTIGHIAPEYLSTGKSSEKNRCLRVKGILRDKKLETLVDPDLEGNYVDDEVEQLIQVALLCTQNTAVERPKMSEVVRMLEGDGLAERWEEWQKEEIFGQDFNQTQNPNIGDALYALKTQLNDPNNVMQSWNATNINPCHDWFHVTCNGVDSVTRLDLGNANLSGQLVQLVPQLGRLKNLQELYANDITGVIPSELGNLTSLVSLDLYMNRLEGVIPDTLGNLKKLRFLRLNNNTLTGIIPASLTAIDSLQVLFVNNPGLKILPRIVPPNSQSASEVEVVVDDTTSGDDGVDGTDISGVSDERWLWGRAKEDPEVHLGQLKRFSQRELQVATDHFSNKNILGQGRFAKVYKGWLADGSLVALKRLEDVRVQGGELQFQTEIKVISMAMHRNLLRLQGFCITPTERLLVYPYMANGSIASCLRDQSDTRVFLDWPIRKRIALGSARGLAYLHDICNPKIIHRDVKAANILLDEEFEPVVGYFGLAKLMDHKDTHVTTAVHGMLRHIAPEYLSTGICSEKTDVFGYGVMLLELITGHRTFDLAHIANDDEITLLDWAKGILRDKQLGTVVDADLEGNYVDDEVELLLRVARLCTRSRAFERPKMSEVVRMLEGEVLAERWKEWREEEILRQDSSQMHNPNINWIMKDSNYNVSNDQLSGPR